MHEMDKTDDIVARPAAWQWRGTTSTDLGWGARKQALAIGHPPAVRNLDARVGCIHAQDERALWLLQVQGVTVDEVLNTFTSQHSAADAYAVGERN